MGPPTGEQVFVFQAPVIDGVRMGHSFGHFAILNAIRKRTEHGQAAVAIANCILVLSTCICVYAPQSVHLAQSPCAACSKICLRRAHQE